MILWNVGIVEFIKAPNINAKKLPKYKYWLSSSPNVGNFILSNGSQAPGSYLEPFPYINFQNDLTYLEKTCDSTLSQQEKPILLSYGEESTACSNNLLPFSNKLRNLWTMFWKDFALVENTLAYLLELEHSRSQIFVSTSTPAGRMKPHASSNQWCTVIFNKCRENQK